MKTAWLGALVGAGLVVAAAGALPDGGGVFAQRLASGPPTGSQGQWITLSTVVADKYQQLTVVDPKQQVVSVYHIDLASGAIELRCVRNIHWDLQMVYYNGKGLLPREIQSLQEPR